MKFTQIAPVSFNGIDGETTFHPETTQISLGQRV
jgi:hypothetical protein